MQYRIEVESIRFTRAIREAQRRIRIDALDAVLLGSELFAVAAANATPPFVNRRPAAKIPPRMFERPVKGQHIYYRDGILHVDKVEEGFVPDVPGDRAEWRIFRFVDALRSGGYAKGGAERYNTRRQMWEYDSYSAAAASPHRAIRYRGISKAGWRKAALSIGLRRAAKGWQNRANTDRNSVGRGSITGENSWMPSVTLVNQARDVSRIIHENWFVARIMRQVSGRLNRFTREKFAKREMQIQKDLDRERKKGALPF